MPVEISTRDLRRSIHRMVKAVRRPNAVYGRASRHMRDYVRETITMQGRKRPYVPLAKMTRETTGKRKALIGLRHLIRARHNSTNGEVFFDQVSGDWDVDMHHRGFRSKAVPNIQPRVMIARHKTGAHQFFFSRKEVKIPAREVWPTQGETKKEVTPIFKTWLDEVARRTWR